MRGSLYRRGVQCPVQQRTKIVAQPGEPREDLSVVAAEAHHFSEPLVDGAGGPIAERPVLHHLHRHAARGDPRHGTYRAEVVVRREVDCARRCQVLGGREVGGPALEHEGAADRSAQRCAHALPFDGRSGVQHEAPGVQLRDELARAAHERAPAPPQGSAAPLPGWLPRLLCQTESGRVSVHLDNRRPVRGEVASKAFEADVDHADRPREQRVDRHVEG